MSNISNIILSYYQQHFNELTEANKFHLASRLYLWNQNIWAKDVLDKLKPSFIHSGDLKRAIDSAINDEPGIDRINALAARRPYFEKYPLLRPASRAFFKANFLLSVYGIDAREQVLTSLDPNELTSLNQQLLNDPEAIAVLSTHAINFLYRYSRLIIKDHSLFEPNYFLDIADQHYDQTSKQDLQLKIYLYTHCIIGETLFYYRKMKNIDIYTKMLAELESDIANNFENINLDNKLEFLVCARILHYKSQIADRIYDEAAQSLSPIGNFIIDTQNTSTVPERADINRSEHRNSLLIMSVSDFQPLN